MGVSKKTYRRHQKTWSFTTSAVDSLLKKEDPEHYFRSRAMEFDPDAFVSKHRGNYESRGGLDLRKFYLSVAYEMLITASHWCEEAEDFMKAQHPWQNRTGDAERGLYATIAGVEDDRLVIYLYHSVYYGVYLETAERFHGKYAIINPTMQRFAPKLTRDLQGIMNRV